MSQENVEVVLHAHAAFSRGDLDAFLADCEPDVTYRAAITQEIEGDAGDFRGHDGIRRWWSDLHDLYDGLRTDVLEVRDLGDRVVLVYVISGRAKGSGLVFEGGQTLAQVVHLRQGRIAEVRDYPGRSEALEAAGLRE
jgi:ketosteroid isomerase-like protein